MVQYEDNTGYRVRVVGQLYNEPPVFTHKPDAGSER